MVKRIYPDDFQVGMTVTVLAGKEVEGVHHVLTPMGPQEVEYSGALHHDKVGRPFEIVGVDLPFIRIRDMVSGEISVHLVDEFALCSFSPQMWDDLNDRGKAALPPQEVGAIPPWDLDALKQSIIMRGLYGAPDDDE